MSDIKNQSIFYKGIVKNNQDPENKGRVQIYIPRLHGQFDSSRNYPWAAYTTYDEDSLPDNGSVVLIGFEANDLSSPIVFGMLSDSINSSSWIGGMNDLGTLAELAANIIFGNEGGYTSISFHDGATTNDSGEIIKHDGSISIGKIQWHAGRAKDLLNEIRNENINKFDSICTSNGATKLSGLVTGTDSWNNLCNWSSACPIGKAIAEILATEESKKIQDRRATASVEEYVSHGANAGITDAACLIYYADLENQWGEGGAAAARAYAAKCNNLEEFHNWCMKEKYGQYASRRQNTYSEVKMLETQGKLTPTQLTGMSGSTGNNLVGWPVEGKYSITSEYGPRWSSFHTGFDIGTPVGTTIYAPISGTILSLAQYGEKDNDLDKINDGVCGYGYYQVIISDEKLDGNNYIGVLMAHQNKKMNISGHVKRGQAIGVSGNTGNSTGPHIHFEVRLLPSNTASYANFKSGTHKDPRSYVQVPS